MEKPLNYPTNSTAQMQAPLAAEAAREAALRNNDSQALSACLADTLVFVHSSGTVDDKASLIAKVAEGRIVYQQVSLQPDRVQLLADGVWGLWGRMQAQIVVGGASRQVASTYATVWTQQAEGSLRLVMHQGTPLPQPAV